MPLLKFPRNATAGRVLATSDMAPDVAAWMRRQIEEMARKLKKGAR